MIGRNCYALQLGNCKGPLSLEHYISYRLLKIIGDTLEISGPPWLKGQTKKVFIKKLGSKILCSHHNNILSELDEEAILFFKALKKYDQVLGNLSSQKNEVVNLSGEKLERWLIKLYLGMHCGKQFSNKLEKPELYLLDKLFNCIPLPKEYGFYLCAPLGTSIQMFNGVGIQTCVSPVNNEIVGILCQFRGVPIILSIRPATDGGTGKVDPPALYHPPGITFSSSDNKVTKSIVFEW